MKNTLKKIGKNIKLKIMGFTLTELLAVIAILGIIALIVFPSVNKSIKNSKEKAYQQQIESILRSAEHWGLENMSKLKEDGMNYITIEELKKSGYLEAKAVINPMTGEEMNGCIIARYESNQYVYSYSEKSCTSVEYQITIIDNGVASVASSIPTGAYILTNSSCTNGGVVDSYDNVSGEVKVTNDVPVICDLEFTQEACTLDTVGEVIGGYICSAPSENCFECPTGKSKEQLSNGNWTCK